MPIALLGASCGGGDDPVQKPESKQASDGPPPDGNSSVPRAKVTTQAVTVSENSRLFEAVGTGRARLSIEVYPAVSEEVTGVYFQAGDSVAEGDVLVQLDDREEKLAVQLAEVELKDARSLLDRYERAVEKGGVPQSEVDSARADFESAEVALEQAKLAQTEHQVRAPFDGHVGLPEVDPGDRVGPNTLITTLDDRAILHVDFEIPEALAGALRREGSERITATTPAYPAVIFEGSITAQGSRIDPERRTLHVRANIENPEDQLRPGMSFTTRWELPGESYPAVPGISLQWGREGSFIWVVRETVARKIPVEVVARSGSSVLLEGDLREGDEVVVEGVQRLSPDVAVEVIGRRSKEDASS